MLPCNTTSLTFATWNANGLLAAEGLPVARRRAKNRTLNKTIGDNDVVAIQEAHEQREHWNTVIRRLGKSHKTFFSSDLDSPNRVWVALIIKLKIYRQTFREEVPDVIPGVL